MASFLQNELHEGYISKSKLDLQFLKWTTEDNMLEAKCKTTEIKFIFRSFVLYLPLVVFHNFLPGN